MAEGSELNLRIRVTPEGVEVLDAIARKSDNAGQSFTRTQATVISLNQALELGRKAWHAIEAAVGGIASIVGEAIQQANEQDVAVSKLNATLKASGQFSEAYSAALVDISQKYEKLSTAGDEAILDVERLLVSFGAAPNKVEGLTRTVLDLSAGLKIDLSSAANLVGRAVAGQTELLSRYGLQVDTTKTKAEQLAELQKLVADRFGGQAHAEIETYAGSLNLAAKAYDDLLKAVGQAITATPELAALFKTIEQTLDGMTEAVKDNRKGIVDFVGGGIEYLISGLHGALETMRTFVQGLELAASGWRNLISVVTGHGSQEIVTPITDKLDAAITKLNDFEIQFKANLGKAKQHTDEVAASMDGVTESEKKAALEAENIANHVTAIPSSKDVDINIRQRMVGGGGGGGRAAGPAAPVDTSGMSTDFLAQYRAGLRGPSGDLTPQGLAALSGMFPGFSEPSPVSGGIASLGTDIVVDTSEAEQEIQKFVRSAPDMTMDFQLTGSPTLPFSDYLGSYAPAQMKKFAGGIPRLVFQTNLSDVVSQSSAWSRRFGDSLLPTGAFDIIGQGAGADPGQLRRAIAEAQDTARYFRWASGVSSGLMPLVNGVTGERLPNAADYERAFQGLAGQMKAQLAAIERGNALAMETADNTRAGVRATSELSRSFSSSTFLGGFAKATAEIIARSTGAR